LNTSAITPKDSVEIDRELTVAAKGGLSQH